MLAHVKKRNNGTPIKLGLEPWKSGGKTEPKTIFVDIENMGKTLGIDLR